MNDRQQIASFVLLGALLAIIFSVTQGEASSFSHKLTVRDLVCKADLIVYGAVRDRTRDGDFLLNAITPLSILKTSVPAIPSAIMVRTSAHDFGGNPKYQPGQEVILFLKAISGSSHYRTVELSQGKFDVKNHRVTRLDLPIKKLIAQIESQDCEPPKQ